MILRAASQAEVFDARAYFELLPAENPYRDILLRVERLPAEEREALNHWVSPDPESPPPELSPALLEFARSVAADVRAAATSAAVGDAGWPKFANPDDPDNPAAVMLPGLGSVRQLARITTKAAESLPPTEAVATYAALAQLGRHQRGGGTLIEQLTGIAVEGIAGAEATKHLNAYSAEDLQRLATAWGSLRAAPSAAESVAWERDAFFQPIVEGLLVPGLRALLKDPEAGLPTAPRASASGLDSDRGRPSGSASSDAGFTRHLRLSSLMDLGRGNLRIVIENTRTGESITLAPGRPAGGIELLSIDFGRQLALIRRGEQEALIHLQAKRFIERDSPALRLRKFLRNFAYNPADKNEADMVNRILDRVRQHPEGLEGYARDLIAAYQTAVDRQLELANQAQAPDPGAIAPGSDDPILSMLLPDFHKLARRFELPAIQAQMIQAAIHHRLVQLGEGHRVAAPSDPWATGEATPFALEETPDGGFLLRSAYEDRPGVPVTFKFAAPNAGFVRQP